MRKLLQRLFVLLMVMLPMSVLAQVPQSGTFKIKNEGTGKYIDVISRYYAKPSSDVGDDIGVTVGYKLKDNSYRIIALNGTDDAGNAIEVFDYVDKAYRIALELATKKANQFVLDMRNVSNTTLEEIDAMVDSICKIYINNHAYMSIIPVGGTPEALQVKAKIDVPSIPKTVDAVYLAYINKQTNPSAYPATAWDWAKSQVIKYLDTHASDATLQAFVRANLDKVQPGTTYYLTADADNTLGYSTSSSAANSTWVMEGTVTENNIVPGIYNIQNVGTEKYVEVTGRYYGKPDLTSEDIFADMSILPKTLVNVEMGQYNRVDLNEYRITKLECNGNDVVAYIQKGVEKATAIVKAKLNSIVEKIGGDGDALMDQLCERLGLEAGSLTYTDVVADLTTAFQECGDYYAYLRLKDNGDGSVSLHINIPEVPALINHVYNKIYNHTDNEGLYDMRDIFGLSEEDTSLEQWVKNQMLDYFENSAQTDAQLKALVENNMGKWTAGKTYYLTADTDDSFGYSENGSQNVAKWKLTEVEGELSGYFRIVNQSTSNAISITAIDACAPDVSESDALTQAGTIWKVTANGGIISGLKVTEMRSQGVDGAQIYNDALGMLKPKLDTYGISEDVLDECYLKLGLALADGEVAYYIFSTTPNIEQAQWDVIKAKMVSKLNELGNFAATTIAGVINTWEPATNYYVKANGTAFAMVDESGIDDDAAKWLFKPIDTESNYFGIKCLSTPLKSNCKYYSTLFVDFPISLPEGVTAYYAETVNDKSTVVSFTAVGSSDIPAQTPVLIESSNVDAASNIVTILDTDVTLSLDNKLQGVRNDDGLFASEAGEGVYVLSGSTKTKDLGFRAYSGKMMSANKAYMVVNTSGDANFNIIFDGVADGIQNVTAQENENNTIYDLQGRRIAKPTKGIYVVNGKKLMVK